MQKGVTYNIASGRAELLPTLIKRYKAIVRVLSQARPGLLRLLLIYSMIATTLLGVLLFYIWDMYEQVNQEKLVLERDLLYWEEVITAHENYPDAYFNAAVYAYRLKNKEKAYKYIEKSLLLDPLFVDAKVLREKILVQ
jgi:tetratricopeptide (TPR) repeat protein